MWVSSASEDVSSSLQIGLSFVNVSVDYEFASQVCGLRYMKGQTLLCGLTNVVGNEQWINITYNNSAAKCKDYFAKCELWILIQTNY